MGEVVAFPDVEAAMVAHLAPLVAGTRVATNRTTRSPDRLVRVQRVGGTRENLVTDAAMVNFECWDATETSAAELAKEVRALVQALDNTPVDVDGVTAYLSFSYEVGGPSFFPHPDTGLARYQHTQMIGVVL